MIQIFCERTIYPGEILSNPLDTSNLHLGKPTNGHAASRSSAKSGTGEPEVWTAPDALADPVISLIVPALNEEKLIDGMLQTFPRELRRKCGIELIVSDGGSSDRTPEIARDHADIVARHVESRRQTIAEGRNLGAEQARGDILVFINADTVPQDGEAFIRGLVEFAAEGDPGTVAFACPVYIAPGERRWSDSLFHNFFNNYVRLLNLIGLGMGRGECQIVRRDPFRAVGGYEKHMAAGEDFDLYRRLTAKGKIGHRHEFRVYESPRRFRRFGYLRVLFEWTLNALAVMILGRSISKEWEEIR